MLNVYELEQKQRALKVKKLKVPIIAATALTLLLVAVSFVSYDSKEPTNSVKADEAPSAKIDTTKITPSETPTPVAKEPKELPPQKIAQKRQDILSPNVEFLYNEQNLSSELELDPPKPQIEIAQKSEIQKKDIDLSAPTEEINLKDENIKESLLIPNHATDLLKKEDIESKHISIIKKDSTNEIDDVIKRFETNKSPTLSLFIARKYYQLGDYKKAYDYALFTNNLDHSIEDSWLIFAKSLVKLGRKDDATMTLNEYISFSKSQVAMQLLQDIESGKFK